MGRGLSASSGRWPPHMLISGSPWRRGFRGRSERPLSCPWPLLRAGSHRPWWRVGKLHPASSPPWMQNAQTSARDPQVGSAETRNSAGRGLWFSFHTPAILRPGPRWKHPGALQNASAHVPTPVSRHRGEPGGPGHTPGTLELSQAAEQAPPCVAARELGLPRWVQKVPAPSAGRARGFRHPKPPSKEGWLKMG